MAPSTKASAPAHWRWLLFLPIPLLWCYLADTGQLQSLENKLLDMRFRSRGEIAAPVKLRYVDLDTRAIEAIGERPWNRASFAVITRALLEKGGAKAIGFDFVFSKVARSGLVDQKLVTEGNRAFAMAVRDHPRQVVLAVQYTSGDTSEAVAEETLRELPLLRKGKTNPAQNDLPEMPEPPLNHPAVKARMGLIDVDVEYSGDSVPRWVPVFVHSRVNTLYHLSLQMVLQHLALDENAVRISADKVEIVDPHGAVLHQIPLREGQLLEANWFSNWDNPELNPRRSIHEIFSALAALESTDAKQREDAQAFFAEFKDALVLIGPVDPLLHDVAPTPFETTPVPKVGLHGNIIKTILSGRYLQHTPRWATWVMTLGLTFVVSVLTIAGGARGVLAKIFALIALGGYTGVAFYLFAQSDLVLPLAAPLGAALSTSFATTIAQLITEEKAKGRIKGMFGAYVSPQLVERMVESGEDPKLGGAVEQITAYFSDIQGFSGFSEKLEPPQLVELMNEYLTACTDIVTAQGGTLDKYIGDAVVAMFGAPIALPDHAFRACVATQLVHRKLAELRVKWKGEGDKWPEIVWKMQSRIGLNSGAATIGNMGSRTRFNYTMMGDNVNLAARMESGAKSWGAYTMCTEATKLDCEKHGGDRVVFRALGKLQVVGRSQAVPIYEIVGLKEFVSDEARRCIALFEQALAKYYARDWPGAIELFRQSAELEPNQPGKTPGVKTNPSLVYIEKVVPEAIEEPPGPDWDGRYVAKEK